MPGMDGFEVLRSLSEENLPSVIFLTAYEQHALWRASRSAAPPGEHMVRDINKLRNR
jgi:CheY-like chemotaxis protein